jgi:hypothetical protein
MGHVKGIASPPDFYYTQCDDFSTCDIPSLPAPSFTPSQVATHQQNPNSQDSEVQMAPPLKKCGRPRKETPLASPETQMLPPLNAPTNDIADNTDNMADNALPPDAPIATNTRYSSHPMVLRQRPNRTTISHLKIAALTTIENIPKVKCLNSILIKKCAKFINNIASLEVLDEYALPRQVTNQATALQIERRRQYLKSLTPAQRNTLLTGDSLFASWVIP